MLKTRIIPTLLYKDHGLVKGTSFDSWRRIGTALPAIKIYNSRQVDELIFVDISASTENRTIDFEIIDQLADDCFMPLTVGGGIKTINDIKSLLLAGADKVSINSAALKNPKLISDSANRFGSQCIVVSIDTKKTNSYQVCINSGREPVDVDPIKWAMEVEMLGAGEILLTSINNDGTMQGYDLDLIKKITSAVKIPVIASGGAGNYNDLYLAITTGGASAVAAASMFHFTEQTPIGAKQYLREKGIPVRI